MAEGSDNYQDILQENFYLFSRYIVAEDFLERLISSHVLTIDDKEVITNQCLHQNRRQRANKLIEILLTRGERGYEQFLEILEYQYPHVFQEVTKREPRDPPPDFQRNRVSDRLRIIRNLPTLLEQLKVQVVENSELDTQLCVLQQLLEVSKEENTALEREVEMLKDVRQDNHQLKIKTKELETENLEHQVTITTWTTKAFQLIEAQSEYKDKSHDLQVKYDDLYIQFTELQKETSIGDKGPEPKGHAVLPREVHRMSPPHVDNAPHYRARLEILEQELDNSQMQCEELTIRMQSLSNSEQNLEIDVDILNKEIRRTAKEKKNLDNKCTNIAVMNESYYKTIQKKNDEIIELQNRSMEEQQRLTELMREKKSLFEQNHRLEADVQSLKAEIDKIKLRFSNSSVENMDCSQQPMSSDSDGGDPEEGPTRVIKRKMQRRNVVRRVYSEEKYEEYALRRLHSATTDLQGGDSGDLNFKANTLPAMANESSEKMFAREVAHFRYTRRKGEKYKEPSSMKVNQGSYYERDGLSSPPLRQREAVSHRVAVINPAGPEDEQDTGSESTVYTPRTSTGNRGNNVVEQNVLSETHAMSGDQRQSTGAQCNSFRKSSRLPTGGKRYLKEDKVGRRNVEGGSQCDSIISQSDSDSDSNVTSDFSCHEVHTVLLPKDCLVVVRPKHMVRHVTMKYSNLFEKLEFRGGNHTGIYTTKQYRLLELNEGEQIKGIIFNPIERLKPVVTYLKGCTLEDFRTLVGGDFINKKKEREICLEVRNSKQEYASACEWMKNNNGNGDYFFVRCNVNLDKKQENTADLKSGDVFLIKNSCYDDQLWQGYVVDARTGIFSTAAPVLIPNMQQANMRRAYSRSCSAEDEDKGKRGGFKVRGHVYDRVLPLKASTKLPVYIFGPDTHVVSAVLDLIASNLSQKFLVDTNNSDGGHFDGEEKLELYRHDMHIVRRGRIENMNPRQSIDRITVLVSFTSELSSANAKKLLGDDFDREISSTTISQSQAIKQKLTQSGDYFEEICLPSVDTIEGLMLSFKSYIEASQKRILWLSSSEMDEQVANRYPSYLGQFCDLSKIMQLHHSNSFNQSLDGEA